jgi:UDP-N-acetylmuramate dehydrogenase
MTEDLKKQLQHLDGVDINFNVTLAGHTSFRVGGPVSCLLRPKNLAALQSTVQVLIHHNHPYFILGRGSNLLISDAGTSAAAISLESVFSQAQRLDDAGRLKVGAGLKLSKLLRFCLQEELSGLEFVVGIPGSIGGALRMNAGTQAGTLADVCEAVDLLLSNGSVSRISGPQLRFSYRKLELPPGAVLLEAELSLTPSTRGHIRERLRVLLEERKEKQPWRLPSAGSVFKNPPGEFAGRLVEGVGLKGYRIGDAQISPKHANFIVNLGRASSRDILTLIRLAQEKVAQEYGVHLELEIEVLGNNLKI